MILQVFSIQRASKGCKGALGPRGLFGSGPAAWDSEVLGYTGVI